MVCNNEKNNTVKFNSLNQGFLSCSCVPGCSEVFRCSGVPGCSGLFRAVPVFLVLIHAHHIHVLMEIGLN